MPSQLVIDLETLTPERAKDYAGIILTLAGAVDENLDPRADDPEKIFGKPGAGTEGPVNAAAPHLVIGSQTQAPPPPPPQQAAPAPPPAAAPSGVVVDAGGIPWDGRIHASSKERNKDGTWRGKRGVDKALVESVTAELRRAMGAPGPQLVQTAPQSPAPQQQAAPPPPSPAAAAEPSQGSGSREAYVALVNRASAARGAGKIKQNQIDECLRAVGMDNMPALGHRLDLVETVANLIDAIVAGASA